MSGPPAKQPDRHPSRPVRGGPPHPPRTRAVLTGGSPNPPRKGALGPLGPAGLVGRAMAAAMVLLVQAYQVTVSPLLGPCCRYAPSCSAYAIEALRTHGAARGLVLAAWRVLRCHPLAEGGYDPVPEAFRLRKRRGGAG